METGAFRSRPLSVFVIDGEFLFDNSSPLPQPHKYPEWTLRTSRWPAPSSRVGGLVAWLLNAITYLSLLTVRVLKCIAIAQSMTACLDDSQGGWVARTKYSLYLSPVHGVPWF